jgi:predicted transcriptional regulator
MGPVLTHRVEIIRLALAGRTMTEICRIMRHSPPAVANYLSTFTRVAQLAARQMQPSQIAFLLGRGRSLVDRYLELLTQCEQDKNFKYHLDQLIQLGQVRPSEKNVRRRSGGDESIPRLPPQEVRADARKDP